MDIVLAFSALCILLVVGKILRVEIRLFQKLYLPASVIGGLLGLVLVQTIGGSLPEATTAGWTQLPGFLINIVFSALFLGVFIPPIRRIWGIAGPAAGVRPDCRLGPVRRQPWGGDRASDTGFWRPRGS